MRNEMKDIDKLIKETLNEEERKFYNELDEQNVIGMLTGLFKGKNAWLLVVMNIMTLVFFALAIYCAIQFFQTDLTNDLIKWGSGAMLSIFAMSMLKVFAWMQMDKNALLREMKRLELQISSLSGKIPS